MMRMTLVTQHTYRSIHAKLSEAVINAEPHAVHACFHLHVDDDEGCVLRRPVAIPGPGVRIGLDGRQHRHVDVLESAPAAIIAPLHIQCFPLALQVGLHRHHIDVRSHHTNRRACLVCVSSYQTTLCRSTGSQGLLAQLSRQPRRQHGHTRSHL